MNKGKTSGQELRHVNKNDYRLTRDRTRRQLIPPTRFRNVDDISAFMFNIVKQERYVEPLSYSKAANSIDKEKWIQSMQEEMDSLYKNQTCKIVDKPRDHKSKYDSCVYFKEREKDKYVYLLLYVDDMLVACQDKHIIQKTKELLKKEFDMKKLGEAKKILGMGINRDKAQDSKYVGTPLGQHFKLYDMGSPISEEYGQDSICQGDG
ncbi:uncharacterized protein LOC143608321 [Bidens hawaiensis]|uniref:uncharacterized protein LOC143608321 n=1 Tax=Bidens hawaiensis TaxID=980011 RepID=UPI00404A4C89